MIMTSKNWRKDKSGTRIILILTAIWKSNVIPIQTTKHLILILSKRITVLLRPSVLHAHGTPPWFLKWG